MNREGIITKVKIKMDEVTPDGVDLPFDDFIGPVLDECAKKIAMICPLHLLTPTELTIFNDWYLPSREDMGLIKTNLYDEGLGDFWDTEPYNLFYWTSTEFNPTTGTGMEFDTATPEFTEIAKNNKLRIRPVREFISSVNYSLTDLGPAGGLIFNKVDNNDGTFTYYEVAPVSMETVSTHKWSNVDLTVTTSELAGTGMANTLAIIAQPGHVDSAANLCRSYSTGNSESYYDDDKCYFKKPTDFLRLYDIKFPLWVKPVREITKSGTPAFEIQDNPYLKSGIGRPSVVLITTQPAGGILQEYLVCGKVEADVLPTSKLYVAIPLPEALPDRLIDSLTWLAASEVLQISGRGDLAQGLNSKYELSLTQLAQA